MNLDQFSHSPSGQLIKVGQGEAAYRAFLPNPLPPSLELDLALVQALSNADRALGELAGLGRNMPNPHLLIQPFIRREAVLSSRIEVADHFSVTHQTAMRSLHRFVEMGIVQRLDERQRYQRFVARRIMEIVQR